MSTGYVWTFSLSRNTSKGAKGKREVKRSGKTKGEDKTGERRREKIRREIRNQLCKDDGSRAESQSVEERRKTGGQTRGEVKGETGRGEQATKLDGKCIEHSSARVKVFQVTESLEKRMNDWRGGVKNKPKGLLRRTSTFEETVQAGLQRFVVKLDCIYTKSVTVQSNTTTQY